MDARIVRHGDAQTFLRRARTWLLQTEPEHNLILAIAAQADDCSGLYAATVEQSGSVVGCALRTPPRKLVLTRVPPGAVDALVVDVAACHGELPAVFGPPAAAREFARQWCDRRGCTARDGMEQRLYRLDRVTPPSRAPNGALRFASSADVGLVASWVACFSTETGTGIAATRQWVAARIAAGDMALWCDGEARTLAGISGRSPNGVRIGYVYTPPEWRGRGYASACVAALSQHALDHGARFCCLYTDLANPVSNTIYQRLGYAPVCDAVDIAFVVAA
ncbi:MAG TPA: GNAT family N-acetyltransferase [Longimicrobiales bacterium]|nr:GNAT family N-acetyltransferase [Longimicrobiales bacterium]